MHTFTNDKSFRFFSSTPDSIQIIMDYLNQELSYRLQTQPETPTPHYLIITDDFHRIKSQDFIKKLTIWGLAIVFLGCFFSSKATSSQVI